MERVEGDSVKEKAVFKNHYPDVLVAYYLGKSGEEKYHFKLKTCEEKTFDTDGDDYVLKDL